jgi:hypothetical protein
LGGKATSFKNILVAAGDGSNTEGLLEEREKDERGRWNRGLPKAVGLFPYQLFIEKKEEKKKVTEKIEPLRITTNNFKTPGNNKFTNLHFDVWGYNSEKQTTVVIEKNGLNYHLFGSKDTRFLSPDSTFSDGTTFQSIINDLEFNKIAKINELIYGKKGYDYWIDYNEKKRDATELKIEQFDTLSIEDRQQILEGDETTPSVRSVIDEVAGGEIESELLARAMAQNLE